jgi:hypothetical protein
MTQQAVVTLMDWATQNNVTAQEEFSVYLSELIADYYTPKEIPITGRVMEAIIENWETEDKKK